MSYFIIYGWMAGDSSHATESQLRLIAVESARRLGYATLKDKQLELKPLLFLLWEILESENSVTG